MTTGYKSPKKIAWGITGAGHHLASLVDIMVAQNNMDIFISQAGKEVLTSYRLMEKLKATQHTIYYDISACSLPVTSLYTGRYEVVIIAPTTSNTIAKMVNGIADNLVTNLFAHAGKCRIPNIILPCDAGSDISSLTPNGQEVPVYVRDIDRKNIERLAYWEGVSLVNDPQQLQRSIDAALLK
ncbi:MAG: hypothetical protein APF84_01490 [Gracilibacter sp. BRH_c7a]|nr:MAG: hypothetical protein APF84_01490 [Gracilibacter sp. BRH_c7a]